MDDEIIHADESREAGANENAPPFDRVDWTSFILTAVLAWVVYGFTLAPDVTMGNAGMLTTGAFYGGVVYPPGYPLWTGYSWLFAHLLPWSNIAWRVNVGSAMAAALASGIVALTVSYGARFLLEDSSIFEARPYWQRNWARLICGYVGGLALGLSGIVWRKAVVADVWTLNLLLFTGILCLALRWIMAPAQKRFLYAGFLLAGLLLTGNQEMLVALPALAFIVMLGDRKFGRDLALILLPLAAILSAKNDYGPWIVFPRQWNWPVVMIFAVTVALGLALAIKTRRVGTTWKSAWPCPVFFLLGLSVCFCVPMASMTNPPVNWGYARTTEGFSHVLSRGQYELIHPTSDRAQYVGQLWVFVKMIGHEFGWLYLVFSALPFCFIQALKPRDRKWLFALTMIFVCTGPALLAELNPAADRVSQELTMNYFMPALAALSVLTGLGLVSSLRLLKFISH